MNRDCKEGLRLRLHYEHNLKEWGWFDAYEKALEIMPVGPAHLHDFMIEAHHAQSEMIQSRHAYVQHMAGCLVCSRRIVASDALIAIREKLNEIRHQ